MKKYILVLMLILIPSIALAGNIGSGTIGPQFSTTGLPQVSAGTVTGNTGWFNKLYINGVDSNSVYLRLDTTNDPLLNDLEGTDFKITDQSLGTPTYSTLNDFCNSFGSAGRKTGGVISDATGGYVAVTAGTGFIKATDDDNAQLMFFDFPAPSNIQIPASSTRYIGVEYNSGSPRVVARTSFNWDLDSEFPLGMVINENINGTDYLYIANNPWWVTDGTTNIIQALRSFGLIRKDKVVGGITLSVTGTRNIAVTSGRVWSGLIDYAFAGLDTSVSGTVQGYWYKAGTGWQEADLTQYSITQWNNVTQTTLQTIDNNKYCNVWIYGELDESTPSIALIYPQVQYNTASDADAATAPTMLPTHISELGLPIGRIIIKQGVTAPVATENFEEGGYVTSVASDHGNLAGLSDDDHTQYLLATGARTGASSQSQVFTNGVTLSNLTSGRITYAGTSGLLQDSANLTFDGTNLTCAGTGTFGAGTDAISQFSRLKVGNVIVGTANDYAGIAHEDHATIGDYAVLQSLAGQTSLNTTSGQEMRLCMNNSEILTLSSTYVSSKSGIPIYANDSSNAKNIQITHNGTNGVIHSSDGTISLGSDNLTTTGDVSARYLYTSDATQGLVKAGVGHLYIRPATSASDVIFDSGDVQITGGSLTCGDLLFGGTGTTTNPIVNNAKFELIEDINQLVGTTYIKGFWIFDQVGATTSITDRSPNGHTVTLSGNASTLSPSVSGLCPNLKFATATDLWYTTDSNDFSFCVSGISDLPFTVICLQNPTSAQGGIVSKYQNSGQYEWRLYWYTPGNLLVFAMSDPTNSKYIGRYYGSSLSSDSGSWHCYTGTYSGNSSVTGIKVYRDGTQIDNSSDIGGTYVAMTNGTDPVLNNNGGAYGDAKNGVVLIISKELTAEEVSRISKRLLSYSGQFQ